MCVEIRVISSILSSKVSDGRLETMESLAALNGSDRSFAANARIDKTDFPSGVPFAIFNMRSLRDMLRAAGDELLMARREVRLGRENLVTLLHSTFRNNMSHS